MKKELNNFVPKSDLSKMKAGDFIFTIREGWDKVIKIETELPYPIITQNSSFTLNGFMFDNHVSPSAWTFNPFEQQTFEPYWAMVWDYDGEKKQKREVVAEIDGCFMVRTELTNTKHVSYKFAERLPAEISIEQAQQLLKELGREEIINTEL